MNFLKEDVVFYYPDGHQEHKEHGHPERPERVERLRDALREAGWWDRHPHLKPISISNNILTSIHSKSYLEMLHDLCLSEDRLDGDTYTTRASWDLAMNTAGGAVATALTVWDGTARRGFALCRPPGHHATRDWGMGFCLLNNIALAAEGLVQERHANKLAIIDLDLHHGNGTQDIFWERGDVLYISTHQSPLYPGSGAIYEMGAGAGVGATVNIPLPPGSGDLAFSSIMQGIILPLLNQFEPQMILVSFGFDVHWRDPLGHLRLSARGYGELISRLCEWADQHCAGRVALFLEGGYDLDAAAVCGQAVTAAMLRVSWQDSLGPSPKTEGTSWQIIEKRVKEIWGL
jgi:acetoin utilization deacetylase AcuC-like enzyme